MTHHQLQADPAVISPPTARTRATRLWLIPLITLLALGCGIAYLATAKPIYTTSARLQLAEGFTPSTQRSDRLPTSTFLHMQIESIQSAPTIAAAIQSLQWSGDRLGNDPVGTVKAALHPHVTERGDGLLLSVDWPQAAAAAQLANALADAYLARASRELSGADPRTAAMQEERQKSLHECQARERALAEFRQANPEFAAADAQKSASERLASLTQALTAAQLESASAKSVFEATAGMLSVPQKAADLFELNRGKALFGSTETEVNQTAGELAQFQAQLAKQKETMLPQNPVVIATQKKIDELAQRLTAQQRQCLEVYRTALEQQWQSAARKSDEVQTLVREQNALVASITGKASRFAELQAALQGAQEDLRSIDERLKDSKLLAAVSGASLRLDQPAQAPTRPSWPVRTRVMSIALAAGILLGCLAAMIRLP